MGWRVVRVWDFVSWRSQRRWGRGYKRRWTTKCHKGARRGRAAGVNLRAVCLGTKKTTRPWFGALL